MIRLPFGSNGLFFRRQNSLLKLPGGIYISFLHRNPTPLRRRIRRYRDTSVNFLPPDLTHPNPTPPDHRNPTPDLSEVASTSVSRPNLWRIRTYLSEPRRRWRDPKAPHRWLRGVGKWQVNPWQGRMDTCPTKIPSFFLEKIHANMFFFGMFRVCMNQWNLLVSFIKLRKIIFIFFIILMRFQCQTGGEWKKHMKQCNKSRFDFGRKICQKKIRVLGPQFTSVTIRDTYFFSSWNLFRKGFFSWLFSVSKKNICQVEFGVLESLESCKLVEVASRNLTDIAVLSPV